MSVTLHAFRLSELSPWSENPHAWLSEAEQRRRTTITHHDRRTAFTAGRLALRWLLSPEAPDTVPITATNDRHGQPGKPQTASGWPSFNLSHSGDWLVVAVQNAGHPIGCDLEACNNRDWAPVLKRFGAPSDHDHFRAAGTAGPRLAAQLWSGREALGKAEGSGMLPVLSLPLNLEDSQHRYQLSGADYWLQWLTGPPDYALAVAGIGVRPARIEYTDQTGTFSAALANEQR